MAALPPQRSKIMAALRIHRNNQQDKSQPPDLPRLCEAVHQASTYAGLVAVAYPQEDAVLASALAQALYGAPNAVVNAMSATATPENTKMGIEKGITERVIRLVPVTPWGNFIPALNALLLVAAQGSFSHILYQSVEIRCTATEIATLAAQFDEYTLVAGKMLEGHQFKMDTGQTLDGVTAPWNTLALWSVAKLSLTGFPLVADGVLPGIEGGVEEVSAIATLQRLLTPECARAILVRISKSDGTWETTWDDEGRRAWHEKKMKSKVTRPALHLQLLELVGTGRVDHIEV